MQNKNSVGSKSNKCVSVLHVNITHIKSCQWLIYVAKKMNLSCRFEMKWFPPGERKIY